MRNNRARYSEAPVRQHRGNAGSEGLSPAHLTPTIPTPINSHLSPQARTRLRRLGLPDSVPAVELRAGRIVASIVRPCRVHLFPDGRLQIEVAPIRVGTVERVAAHVEGATLARSLREGGAR